jgi:hypothetical protein
MRPTVLLVLLTLGGAVDARAQSANGWTLLDDFSSRSLQIKDSNHLSAWKEVKCWELAPERWVILQAHVFREPVGNADNFIAKLTVDCSTLEYPLGVQIPSDVETVEVFHGEFRKDSKERIYLAGMTGESFAIGLRVRMDLARDYVKSLSLYGAQFQSNDSLGSYADPQQGNEGPWSYNIGPSVDLLCPDQKILAGMGVRYDTSKSKIRMIRIHCRTLRKS